MLTGKGWRPGPPSIERSTKVAIAIVAGVVLGGLAVPWFPYPAGWIYFVAVVYVAIPLLLMAGLDISRLRQLRTLARNMEVFAPETESEQLWVNVDQKPIADEYLAKWRRWSRWLVGLLALAAAIVALGAPVGVALIPAAIGLAWEAFLVKNVLEWLVPANWHQLSSFERWRIRGSLAVATVVNASIALAIILIVFYLFTHDRPIRWNHFAFTFFSGAVAVACTMRSYRYFGQLRRAVPPDEERTTRPL